MLLYLIIRNKSYNIGNKVKISQLPIDKVCNWWYNMHIKPTKTV